MSQGGAFRSRLLELRRELGAARAGREVLADKRELLLRELRRAVEAVAAARLGAGAALDGARSAVARARASIGTAAVEAALLAQPETASVERRASSVIGAPVVRLSLAAEPFRPRYGPLGTSAALDEAGVASVGALAALVALADAESRERGLRLGLARTARRLAALEDVVMPRLAREIRDVASALDEEERDEALRLRHVTGR